ncbi:TPA: hypothetical protein N0F65_010804 [Lagenidium giganteum]|uniref:Uncharacterized protein n=1 Tax=Lagenidium giganteum TaxID=4803 RepID=A0AAV2YJ64_9STRA|nr:TPA: hypothetical protein N0F65_010804 [Lagenidium giganteum]
MIDRFRMQEEKKARKRCTKRNEAETREKASLKFAPKLNPKSRQIASHYPDFLERQATLLEYKKQARAYQHQLEEEAIGRDRVEDLHRNVRTPCICGLSRTQNNDVAALMVGNSSPSPVKSSIKASSLHTKACQRFMEMCAAMNQSFIIQRKKEQMKRSIDDMMAFHEEKRQRQQARAQIAQAKEALETTFKPQINATSERLYSNMVRSGRLEREWTERVAKPRKQPSMPKLSFQPTISKRSKQLLQKKHQFSAEAVDDVSDSQNDVFSRLQRSTLQSIHGTSKKSQPSTRGPSPPPAHWNVIQFDESKCGFILQSFELPVAFG